MNDEIKKILQEILILSIEATATKKCTVFMKYTAHTNWIEFLIYEGEWESRKQEVFNDFCYLPNESFDKGYEQYFVNFLGRVKKIIDDLVNKQIKELAKD